MNNIDYAIKRKPSTNEIEKISRWVETYYTSFDKMDKSCSVIFFILGILLLSSIFSKTTPSLLFSIIMSLLFFWLSKFFWKGLKLSREQIEIIKNGDFLIIDGYVSKTGTGSGTARKIMIWFTSYAGDFNDGWYPIIKRNVKVGSKILITYPASVKNPKAKIYVFSEYMLSDEGYKSY